MASGARLLNLARSKGVVFFIILEFLQPLHVKKCMSVRDFILKVPEEGWCEPCRELSYGGPGLQMDIAKGKMLETLSA